MSNNSEEPIIEKDSCKYGLYTCSNIGMFCDECEDGDNYELWETTPKGYKKKLENLQNNFRKLDAKTQAANNLCKSFEKKIRNLKK